MAVVEWLTLWLVVCDHFSEVFMETVSAFDVSEKVTIIKFTYQHQEKFEFCYGKVEVIYIYDIYR